MSHVCTVSSGCTVARTRRAVAFVRRHWRRVRTAAGANAKHCGRGLKAIAACEGHSVDCARWQISNCNDYTSLRNALMRVAPTAITTIRVLDSAIEAMASGYWNGAAACDDSECTEVEAPT